MENNLWNFYKGKNNNARSVKNGCNSDRAEILGNKQKKWLVRQSYKAGL